MSSPPEDLSAEVPYAQTAAGKFALTKMFLDFERGKPTVSPTMQIVLDFLTTLDVKRFPFNASIEDDVGGDKLKSHSRLAATLWMTLLLQYPQAPPTSSAANPTQPPTVLSPLKGEQLGLATTLETQRIRLLAHSAAGASTGAAFFHENLELQTQRLLVQGTIATEAIARCIAALHGLRAVDADGTLLTLDQIVELIPPAQEESAAISKDLAGHARDLKKLIKYLFDSVKLATRVPGFNGFHVLQELEHRLRCDLEEVACDPSHAYKTSFTEQAEAAAKRLKENVPGSLCPALALVNKPVAVPQPPKAPADEKAKPAGRDADRPGRAAPYRNRTERGSGEDYDARPRDHQRGYEKGKGPYRGGWQKDNRSRYDRD